jgi:hypothetical protein
MRDGHGTRENDWLRPGRDTAASAYGLPEAQGGNRGIEAREVQRKLTWGGGTVTERNPLRTDTHSPKASGHKNE